MLFQFKSLMMRIFPIQIVDDNISIQIVDDAGLIQIADDDAYIQIAVDDVSHSNR